MKKNRLISILALVVVLSIAIPIISLYAAPDDIVFSNPTLEFYAEGITGDAPSKIYFTIFAETSDDTLKDYEFKCSYIDGANVLVEELLSLRDAIEEPGGIKIGPVNYVGGVARVTLGDSVTNHGLPHGVDTDIVYSFAASAVISGKAPLNAGSVTLSYVNELGSNIGKENFTCADIIATGSHLHQAGKYLGSVVFRQLYIADSNTAYNVIYRRTDDPADDLAIPYKPGEVVTVLTAEEAALPKKPGYIFVCWERDHLPLYRYWYGVYVPGDVLNGSGEPGFEVIVSIYPNDGSAPHTGTFNVGSNGLWDYEPPGREITNRFRNGTIDWKYTDINNLTDRILVGAQFTMLYNYADIILYPVWEEGYEDHTVTFVYRDAAGEWTSVDVTVPHGEAAIPPTLPTTVAGYVFDGWDKDFSDVTGDMTVTAKYVKELTSGSFKILDVTNPASPITVPGTYSINRGRTYVLQVVMEDGSVYDEIEWSLSSTQYARIVGDNDKDTVTIATSNLTGIVTVNLKLTNAAGTYTYIFILRVQ